MITPFTYKFDNAEDYQEFFLKQLERLEKWDLTKTEEKVFCKHASQLIVKYYMKKLNIK